MIATGLNDRHLIRWAFSFLRPVKVHAILSCACQALWIGIEILAVWQTAEIVNQIKNVQFSGQPALEGFWNWLSGGRPEVVRLRTGVLALAGLAIGLGVLTYLRDVTNAKLSAGMLLHIRRLVYDKLQRVGFGFHDRNSTGELINRALNDLQNVGGFLNSALLLALEIVLMVGGYLVLLLVRSPWVALLAVAPLPLWTWYFIWFSRRAQRELAAVMEVTDRNIAIVTENIAGVHVVKALAAEDRETCKYEQNCDTLFGRMMKQARLFANFTAVVRGGAAASHLSLFLVAGVLILKGRLSPGDVLILGSAMGAILSRLQQVAEVNQQYQSAIVSSRRLHEILEAPPTVVQRPQPRTLPPGRGAIRFERVTFGYDPHRPVLRDVSFEVPGGSMAAVIGPTGAGKTTLMNLIARFYDPQEGRILIDGTDIREVGLEELRAQVAYVFQDTFLFSETVEANIAYGRPGLRNGPVEAAARLAQAHEFVVTLPNGYESPLGERGASLSGGQRQRLAIARAVLSDPRVLILDDATAAVDSRTEGQILEGMDCAMCGRTTLVIAHRISTVRRADLVIVLKDGRVTQMGTHEQLMAAGGHYREIASVQLPADVIDEEGGGTGDIWPH